MNLTNQNREQNSSGVNMNNVNVYWVKVNTSALTTLQIIFIYELFDLKYRMLLNVSKQLNKFFK